VVFKRNKRVRATRVDSLADIEEMTSSGRPVLIDFWQTGCQPCRTMDGIVDELADEYRDTAHVAKVDVRRVPGAAEKFAIRSTPTFVLLATSHRARKKAKAQPGPAKVTQRWRASGLIKKDALARLLESNGAQPREGANREAGA
jgi:thioredoxin 1